MHRRDWLKAGMLGACAWAAGRRALGSDQVEFPGRSWRPARAEEVGLDAGRVETLAERLGGNGCVIRRGRLVKAWGDVSKPTDWYSSVKPVLSTLLWFAVAEGQLESVNDRVAAWGWPLREKDQEMTFRHLANMTSGYARPERPGEAFAYNDFAIQLYQKTLFDRVFEAEPSQVVEAEERLGPLGFEDGWRFNARRRLYASARDFARLGWFWLNRGRWGERSLLPARFLDDYFQPDVAADLPKTDEAETDDYLKVGSFGGGSDHFTNYGPGIYGFNFWFNGRGRTHEGRTWPDAPEDAVMTLGFGGNCMAMLPTMGLVVACGRGNWGTLEAGRADSAMNRRLSEIASMIR